KREVVGFRANVAQQLTQYEEEGRSRWQYRVEPNELPAQLRRARLPQQLNRNLDHDWQQALQRTSAERRVGLRWEVELGPEQWRFGATSEEGVSVSADIEVPVAQARQADCALEQMQDALGQLGNTHYHATAIRISGGPVPFLPGSRL